MSETHDDEKKENMIEAYERLIWDAWPVEDLTWNALGLCAEAGEFGNRVKKLRYMAGNKVDTKQSIQSYLDEYGNHELADELGDVMWHVAQCCHILGVSMQDVMHHNIQKTQRRNGK